MPDRDEALGLKIELQSMGARVSPGVSARTGGAGPADGVTIEIGGLVATVPTVAGYVERSPFMLDDGDGSWELLRGGVMVCEVHPLPEPAFYAGRTSEGVPLRSLALRHGRDGVGSTVAQECAHGERACLFCGIDISRRSGETVAVKSPRQMGEVARAAASEGLGHFVLTSGSTIPSEEGMRHMAECAAAVKESAGMKVHVQFEPPLDLSAIDEVAKAADSAAINIECFEPSVRARVTPGKAAVSLDRYEEAWRRAVDAFGPGQVTSFVIFGLGEVEDSALEGCRRLAAEGVFPYMLPLRPIRGTPMGEASPPSAGSMARLYERAAEIIRAAGLRASDCKAGCVRCSACSALTDITG